MENLEEIKELFASASVTPYTEVEERHEVYVTMSDGIRLRTVYVLPRGVDKGPVILMRSCYIDQKEKMELYADEFAKRGFIFVYQWCRGIGESEGVWEPNVNERSDGLDTVHWLCSQKFTDCIGYYGDSYLALAGWCMADAVPDQVKSMYLGVYGTDRFTSAYKDGLFRQDILTSWAMQNAGVPVEADRMESYRYCPQRQVDEDLWKIHLDWYRDWIDNTQPDDDYWNKGFWKRLREIPGKVRIPLYIREGWYDHHFGSALIGYSELSPEARKHSVFQIGPWNHGYQPAVTGQPLSCLKDDRIDSLLEWFTETLVEKKLPEQAVYTYVIGADRCKKWDQFPVNSTTKRILYFSGEKKGEDAFGLVEQKPDHEYEISYVYDPQNPVPSHGAESLLATWNEIGSLIQPSCGYREDVLSFVSEPLKTALEINGSINVKLYVSSDAEDTSFSAKIMEIFEDGTAVNIRGSITTLAFRNGNRMRGTYTPYSIVEINISMWDIAWKVRKGSRIRVDISSSDFPEYSVHSNYPGIWSRQTETRKASQAVYMGGFYNSSLELPVTEG